MGIGGVRELAILTALLATAPAREFASKMRLWVDARNASWLVPEFEETQDIIITPPCHSRELLVRSGPWKGYFPTPHALCKARTPGIDEATGSGNLCNMDTEHRGLHPFNNGSTILVPPWNMRSVSSRRWRYSEEVHRARGKQYRFSQHDAE